MHSIVDPHNSKKVFMDIISFVQSSIDHTLLPVQQFLLKVLYGLSLDNSEKTIVLKDDTNTDVVGSFTEREFFDFLVEEGRINQKEYREGKEFSEMVLCAGRRASKTTLLPFIIAYEIYRLLQIANPQEHFRMAQGFEIRIHLVSITKEHACTLLEMVKYHLRNYPSISERVVNSTKSFMTFQTDADIEKFGKSGTGTIKLVATGNSLNTFRGVTDFIVVMDEIAFSKDYATEDSSDTLMRVIYPSFHSFIIDGEFVGKMIMASSPCKKDGLFYNAFQSSKESDKLDSIVSFQMYTAMMNPLVASDFLKDCKQQDEKRFMWEFGGEFMDSES